MQTAVAVMQSIVDLERKRGSCTCALTHNQAHENKSSKSNNGSIKLNSCLLLCDFEQRLFQMVHHLIMGFKVIEDELTWSSLRKNLLFVALTAFKQSVFL